MYDLVNIERSIIKKFRKEIWRMFVKAVRDYKMISEGDKIAVCISGGKDSFLLAKCLEELKRHGDINFDLVYLTMNPGYNERNLNKLLENANILNIPVEVFNTNIFNVVEKTTDSPCYLCARMRRGNLYAKAKEYGCNKIALGHHFDDVIETILMGMLYGAQIQTMMPKLHSTNFEGMELIRPLYLVKEESIIAWAKYNELSFLQCACNFTEKNNLDNVSSKRLETKNLIKELRKKYEDIDINIFRSVEDVNLNTIIGYHKDDFEYNFLDDYDKKQLNNQLFFIIYLKVTPNLFSMNSLTSSKNISPIKAAFPFEAENSSSSKYPFLIYDSIHKR